MNHHAQLPGIYKAFDVCDLFGKYTYITLVQQLKGVQRELEGDSANPGQ